MERLVEFIEVPIDLRIGIVLLLNLLQQLRRQIDTACRSPGREGLTDFCAAFIYPCYSDALSAPRALYVLAILSVIVDD
jgi:hypothetical protein